MSFDHSPPGYGIRASTLAYGVLTYAIFFATFVYAIGFVGNIIVPKTIDGPPTVSTGLALMTNVLLLLLFAAQHSVMARPRFKRWWAKFVPPAAERSTYVLFSCVALLAVFLCWQPLGGSVWHVTHPIAKGALYGGFALGWIIVLSSSFLVSHFDLFGLRQVWLFYKGREYSPLEFATPWPYKVVRHPLYLGWLCAFWFTPTMSVTHLVFATVTTAYILFAVRLEENDLADAFDEYEAYQRQVPMLIPRLRIASQVRRALALAP